jgi:S1-C subfamily serine protease
MMWLMRLLFGITLALATVIGSATPARALEEDKGVLIVAVQRSSPAAEAGLRRGDVILKVNEVEVNDAGALRDALAALKPGEEVRLRIARGEAERTLSVVLGQADGRSYLGVVPFEAAPAFKPPAQKSRPPEVKPDDEGDARRWLEQRFAPQARITEVITDSPAAKAGLRVGDVLLAINDKPLDWPSALGDLLANYKPGDEITLKIKRDDAERSIKVRLGENPERKGAPYLGIRYALAIGSFQLPFESSARVSGASVVEVVAGSPADKAGLKAGDLIVAANDKPIERADDLVQVIQRSKPGDQLTLSVRRAGQEKPRSMVVTLGRHPDKAGQAYLGVSLGNAIFGVLPGQEGGGLEILPGFRLPFELPIPPLPQPRPEMEGRGA